MRISASRTNGLLFWFFSFSNTNTLKPLWVTLRDAKEIVKKGKWIGGC